MAFLFYKAMARKKKQKVAPDKTQFLKRLGKKYAKELTQKATQWELSFHKKLKETGLYFIFQYPIVCNGEKLFIIDFYIPKYKLAIELDGQWHYTPEMIIQDKLRTKLLKKEGIRVLRIANRMEDQIKPSQIIEFIKSLIGSV